VRGGTGVERRKERLGDFTPGASCRDGKKGGEEKDQEPWTGQASRKKGTFGWEKK
jgi:hypothetical protein